MIIYYVDYDKLMSDLNKLCNNKIVKSMRNPPFEFVASSELTTDEITAIKDKLPNWLKPYLKKRIE